MATPQPTEQYVLLVDLLGFREAVLSWDDGRQNSIVELMRFISTVRSEYVVRTIQDERTMSLGMKPTATTFSDLAVISYPVEPPFALPNDILGAADTIWRDEVLRHMIDLVAQLAASALRLELLVRGGICRGKLVHNADFILGPALIEAYRLESQTAIYPRIIVSSSLHEGDENLFPSLLRVDQRDGLAHLDYLPQLAALEGAKGLDGGAWRAARLLDIDSNKNATGPDGAA